MIEGGCRQRPPPSLLAAFFSIPGGSCETVSTAGRDDGVEDDLPLLAA